MLKKILYILTPEQRKSFYGLQILMILMAVFELLSIVSIGPFLFLIANPDLVQNNTILSRLYYYSHQETIYDFFVLIGFFILFILVVSSLLSFFATWRFSLFAYKTGVSLAERLFKYYLKQSWLFHVNCSSSVLTKKLTMDCNNVTMDVILPFIQINAKLVTVLIVGFGVFIYNPFVALCAFLIFSISYLVVYIFIFKLIARNGEEISSSHTLRYKILSEVFGGIKDLILLGRTDHYSKKIHLASQRLAKYQAFNAAIGQCPRYIIECISFGSMIIFVIYLFKNNDGDISKILPVLSVYALAGLKLLPAFQQIYQSFTRIKGGMASLDKIEADFFSSNNASVSVINSVGVDINSKEKIILNNINFSYPDSKDFALSNVNLQITMNTTVGFVGYSGSGKSTLIDVILGLVKPNFGYISLDDQVVNSSNIIDWQKNIGYVAQNIFLSEGSIAENIAFGVSNEEIDFESINEIIRISCLEELINELPEGLNTLVGERGVRLSGGQRQRIGIARAMYSNAKVLIFDEATSALDGVTERKIMNAINSMNGQRTIIMIAHRLKTLVKCDCIYMIDGGKLVDQGTYAELLEKNKSFASMAKLA